MREIYSVNPYEGTHFLSFFWVLLQRVWLFISGQLTIHNLATDEIQLLVLIGIAVSSSLVGTFLVLRRSTMIANALSHTILLGIILSFLIAREFFSVTFEYHQSLNIYLLLFAALLTSCITAFCIEFLTRTAKLQEDASIGIVFTSMFALGIVLVTLFTRNAHIGLEAVMGNADALQLNDSKLVYIVLALNVLSFSVFFKEFKLTTFDAPLAKTFGISTLFFNFLLMLQVSSTTVSAFRAVGVLMVLAFITGPALTARLLTDNLKKMLIGSTAIGIVAVLMGVSASRHLLSTFGTSLSTSGIVVFAIVFLFFLLALLKYCTKKLGYQKLQKGFI